MISAIVKSVSELTDDQLRDLQRIRESLHRQALEAVSRAQNLLDKATKSTIEVNSEFARRGM